MITNDNLPLFVELFADGTGLGKSFAASRIRYHCDLAGIPNTLVRIETRGVQVKLRKDDVSIAVEDFAQASERPGGVAGVLQPLSAAILAGARSRSVIICDWAGGLARHHAEYLAKTRLDTILKSLGMTGLSIVVTTNRTEHMRQAASNLRDLAEIAPNLQRGILLNHRFGAFNFISGSQPDRVFGELKRAANNCAVIEFHAVVGESWKAAEDAHMSMTQVIASTPAQFSEKTGLDELTAAACITEVAAFWETSQTALSRVLRFRPAAGK